MKNYVPTTLYQYINESKSITLKSGYKGERPVVVGANAPVRNQILAYVAESVKVGAADLKKFIAGLNETNANPNAAANMWLRRNGKYFVTESKGGKTFFKLSQIGQRLVNSFAPAPAVNEEGKDRVYVDSPHVVDRIIRLSTNPEVGVKLREDIESLRAKYPDFEIGRASCRERVETWMEGDR